MRFPKAIKKFQTERPVIWIEHVVAGQGLGYVAAELNHLCNRFESDLGIRDVLVICVFNGCPLQITSRTSVTEAAEQYKKYKEIETKVNHLQEEEYDQAHLAAAARSLLKKKCILQSKKELRVTFEPIWR